PAQVYKVRLGRFHQRLHPDFMREPAGLARVAATAGGHHVRPRVESAARQRNDMIARERLAWLEVGSLAPAILALVVIAREQEGIRDLSTEASRHVDELRKAND